MKTWRFVPLFVCAASALGQQTTLTYLGPTTSGGPSISDAQAVSSDGHYVVGSDGYQAVMWTAEGGFTVLGLPEFEGFTQSAQALAAANNGVVVGLCTDNEGNGEYRPWKWSAGAGFEALDDFTRAAARDVSADGQAIVGDRITGQLNVVAYRWDGSFFDIFPSDLSLAFGISDDGNFVGGTHGGSIGPSQAFRWSPDFGVELAPDIPGGVGSTGGNDISQDGSTVVGYGRTGQLTFEAMRYSPSTGTEALGWLPGSTRSSAFAVNGDGSLVGGNSIVGSPTGASEDRAFLWRPGSPCGGMMSFKDWIAAKYNIQTGDDKFRIVNDISRDGSVIVGTVQKPGFVVVGFVLRISPCTADYNNDGQIDFFDYLDFAQAFNDESCLADFNNDGQVDFFDYLDFAAAFDSGCD
jgi:uncharacterized membrane protein